MTQALLLAGFKSPSSSAQRCFRAVLGALAEPGIPQRLDAPQEARAGCQKGIASIGLSLLDSSTSFYVHDLSGLSGYLRFHTGAADSPPQAAQWVFAGASGPDLLLLTQSLNMGSLECPEQAATLVLQLDQPPTEPMVLRLRGPGIQGARSLPSFGIPAEFWAWRQAVRARYPLGLDLLLVFAEQVWAIPRSTVILAEL